MFTRVINKKQTTYSDSFDRKEIRRETGRSLVYTSGGLNKCYVNTPKSLYQSDTSDLPEHVRYQKQRSFKMELTKLPPEFSDTVKVDLQPSSPQSLYQTYYGTIGQTANVTKMAVTPHQLSKQTKADVSGTTHSTKHPPGYGGHIPKEWRGNLGKSVHEDRNLEDATFQFHTMKTGYSGYIPSCNMSEGVVNLPHTSTTYRDMCDEVGYKCD